MIYGLNFGAPPIPTTPRSAFRKFPQRVKLHAKPCTRGSKDPLNRVCHSYGCTNPILAGIGQSPEERDAMLMQANNGRRQLHVEERQTASGVWYGIYVW